MVYASSQEIDNLAGNKIIYDSTGANMTNTVLSDAVARGDAAVVRETGVTNWDTNSALYPSVKEAAELFGAAYILRRYGKNENEPSKESMDYYQLALDICAGLAKSSTESVVVSSKAYKSYPINRTAGTFHRSLHGEDSSAIERGLVV